MATIYNYINTLGSKIVIPILMNPIDLKTILTNIQAVIPSYLSFPTKIWPLYEFLEINPLIYNETLIILLIVPLVDSTFYLKLNHIHTIPMVKTGICKTFKIELKKLIWPITNDKKYFTHP